MKRPYCLVTVIILTFVLLGGLSLAGCGKKSTGSVMSQSKQVAGRLQENKGAGKQKESASIDSASGNKKMQQDSWATESGSVGNYDTVTKDISGSPSESAGKSQGEPFVPVYDSLLGKPFSQVRAEASSGWDQVSIIGPLPSTPEDFLVFGYTPSEGDEFYLVIEDGVRKSMVVREGVVAAYTMPIDSASELREVIPQWWCVNGLPKVKDLGNGLSLLSWPIANGVVDVVVTGYGSVPLPQLYVIKAMARLR